VFRWVKHLNQTFIPAVNQELEGTDIEINWSEQYGGSLAKVGGVLEAIEEGLAEVGIVSSLFEAAKLAPQNVTYFTPFVTSDVTTISNLIDTLHEENPELRQAWEANNLEYLGAAIGIDDYLLMTNFPVNSIEDLEGKKIGAPGPAVNWLKGTGAIGVSGNLTTYYNEIKTGVYDGVIVFATAALPGKLYEVAPYITRVGFGAQYAGGIAANKDWYEAQPEALQKALKAGGVAQREAYHRDLEAAVTAAFEAMQANGATITDVSPEFRMQWAKGMDNVAKEWAAQLDSEGQPGSEVLAAYMNAMREAGAQPLRNWDQE
jgi:TRAP-type C4-dicarboxylate transport system substrate-binding protein